MRFARHSRGRARHDGGKISTRRRRRDLGRRSGFRHLGGARDLRHRFDGLDGPRSDRRLSGKHDGVRAVVHGPGHVRDLGARRRRVLDHRLEHLRRDDDGHRVAPARREDLPLRPGHAREADLDAEVAAGDHERVKGVHDLLEAGHRLRLLERGQMPAVRHHHKLRARNAADDGNHTPDRLHHVVPPTGVEPATSSLQVRRSTN